MSPRPLLVIPEAGKEALAKKEPQKVHPLVQRAAALHMRRQMFGPSMKPTFRQQCLQWSSFYALKKGML